MSNSLGSSVVEVVDLDKFCAVFCVQWAMKKFAAIGPVRLYFFAKLLDENLTRNFSLRLNVNNKM